MTADRKQRNHKSTSREGKNKRRDWRGPAALIVTAALLVSGGVGYRLAAAHVTSYTGSLPLPPGALEGIPMEIGLWQGRDAPIPEEIVPYLDAQTFLSRNYTQTAADIPANLFIAYGIRLRDFMIHRPEVCYRVAGFSLKARHPFELTLPNGAAANGEIMVFSRGSLGAERHDTVAVYYIADGVIRPDISLARWQLPWSPQRVEYLAKVQVTCSHAPAEAAKAMRTVKALAQESLPPILRRMPDLGEDKATPGNDGHAPEQAGSHRPTAGGRQ